MIRRTGFAAAFMMIAVVAQAEELKPKVIARGLDNPCGGRHSTGQQSHLRFAEQADLARRGQPDGAIGR